MKRATTYTLLLLISFNFLIACEQIREYADAPKGEDPVAQTVETAHDVSQKADDVFPFAAWITAGLGIIGTGWQTYKRARNGGALKALSEGVEAAKGAADEDGRLSKGELVEAVERVAAKRGYKIEIDKVYDQTKRG